VPAEAITERALETLRAEDAEFAEDTVLKAERLSAAEAGMLLMPLGPLNTGTLVGIEPLPRPLFATTPPPPVPA
jgi:hypothetical protein